jgi:transposase
VAALVERLVRARDRRSSCSRPPGGLEVRLAAALAAAGLPVAVVNPRQVRAFARATGRLAKTDRLDAAAIARFAEAVRPPVRPLPDEATRHLGALVARRRQLLEMLVAERNRRHAADPPCTGGSTPTSAGSRRPWPRSSGTSTGRSGRARSGGPRRGCSARCRASARERAHAAGRAARARLAHPPQAAALVGVAPFSRDSGTTRGRRTVWGGRAALRACLYMAAVAAAAGSNPAIAGFYKRLRLAGKPAKLALTACMRKLVVVLNAMLRTDTAWKQA